MVTENQKETKGGKKGKTLIIIGLLIIIAVVLAVYFFVYNGSSRSNKSGQTTTEMKAVKVKKLDAQNVDFSLDLSSSTSLSDITPITNFEGQEKWQGGGVYDKSNYYEGNSSLSLVSVDRKELKTYLKKDLDLSKMEYIEFMVNVSDIDAVESLQIYFGDKDMKNYYYYNLSNLSTGWQLIQIPKRQFVSAVDLKSDFSWSKVKRVQFNLFSRIDSVLMVRVDKLIAVNNSYQFTKDWKVRGDKNKEFLSLYRREGKNKLIARSSRSASTAILDGVKNADNFVFSAKVSPQSTGQSGLFVRGNYNSGYGYYFLLGGVRDNKWQIKKLGFKGWSKKAEIVEGDIGNNVFQNNKEYWLRVEAQQSKLTFFLSFDGDKYFKLGKLQDSQFRSGGVGLAVFNGWSLFDDFKFKKL